MTEDWNSIDTLLPPCNVIVKVKLLDGSESFDFVKKPINRQKPFKRHIVSAWKFATSGELNRLLDGKYL